METITGDVRVSADNELLAQAISGHKLYQTCRNDLLDDWEFTFDGYLLRLGPKAHSHLQGFMQQTKNASQN